MSKTIIDVKHFKFRWSRITRNCCNICVLRAPRSNLIYTQVLATLTLFQVCKHFLLMKQILTFSFSSMRYCDSPLRFCAVCAQSQNKFLHKTSHRDAGTRKGPGGQNLLKGTDKILIMLKSIPWNLEGQLHSYCAKFLPIIFLA